MISTRVAWIAAAAACLLACCWLEGAEGHGLMIAPISRNYYAYRHPEYLGQPFWNPQGVNGGGPAAVSNNGEFFWPNGRASLCGDKYTDNPPPFMKPTPISATYKAGELIEMKVILYNNHQGQFRMNLCWANATFETRNQDCMPLKMADTGEYVYIPPPPANGTDSGMPAYLHPYLTMEKYDGEGHFNGNPVMVTKWRMPANAECAACIMQWHWITATTCEPPCNKQLDPYCGTRVVPPCGPQSQYPEEFWNCADISIVRAKRKASRKMLQGGTESSSESSREAGRSIF